MLCITQPYIQGRRERDRAPGPNLGEGPSNIFSSVIVKWLN